jgi:hypothetical protein
MSPIMVIIKQTSDKKYRSQEGVERRKPGKMLMKV